MAHFAKLDENNFVIEVIVIHNNELLDENGNESEQQGIDFCTNLFGGTWIQTSYNGNLRKNYAGVGFIYDFQRDAFIAPRPNIAIGFDEKTCQWIMPERENDTKEL
jgi:hypothetical protein